MLRTLLSQRARPSRWTWCAQGANIFAPYQLLPGDQPEGMIDVETLCGLQLQASPVTDAMAAEDDQDADLEEVTAYEAAEDMRVPVSVAALRQRLAGAKRKAQTARDDAAAAAARQSAFAASSLQACAAQKLLRGRYAGVLRDILLQTAQLDRGCILTCVLCKIAGRQCGH